MRLFAIGTCRLHNPLQTLAAKGEVDYVYAQMRLRYTYYFHTTSEILQFLKMLRGDIEVPHGLQDNIMLEGDFRRPANAREVLAQADAALVEICSDKIYRAGAFVFRIDELQRRFPPSADPDIAAWRAGVEGGGEPDEALFTPAIEALRAFRGEVTDDEIWLVRNLRMGRQSEAEMAAELREIAAILRRPVGVLVHIDATGSDGKPIAQRRQVIGAVKAAAALAGMPVFDPAVLMEKWGQSRLMMHGGADSYHYSEDMLADVGREILAFAGRELMLDAVAENLLGEKSELASWTMVRAHGGAAAAAAPFRLSEDTTLHNSHDMRAALAIQPEAGQSYNFGVFVRPGERGFVSIWIGDGANRAEAVFDASGATVVRQGEAGAGWVSTDAGIVPANNGWRWCHLTARATTAGDDIGISILLMRDAASAFYDGDGKSGLWLMKPWLEAGERLVLPIAGGTEIARPQSAATLDLVEELNALLVGFVAERYRAMGPDASGLLNFYVKRLENRRLFLDYDLGIASWILNNRPHTDLIVDVGTGIGQFCFLLAANGRDCIAFEGTATRFHALEALHGAVKYWKPEVAARVALMNGRFPLQVGGLAGRKTLAVFACFVATLDADGERELVRGLHQFSEVILDLRVFGRMMRNTPQERDELQELLREEGFSDPEPVLVTADEFYVIIRPRVVTAKL